MAISASLEAGRVLMRGFTSIRDVGGASWGQKSWNTVSSKQVVTEPLLERLRNLGEPSAFEGSDEERLSLEFFGEKAYTNSNQWDHVFEDGAMFKHGNMGQGIYVDRVRDFCGMTKGRLHARTSTCSRATG
jgi:hypothetical protein